MKRVLAILCVLACLCALCVPAMATEETVTIHARIPTDWTEAYLYVWSGVGDGAKPVAEWPGLPMNNDGDSWFSAQVPVDMEWAIVTDNNGKQTSDLEIIPGVEYWIVMSGDLSYVEALYEEPTEDELPINDPAAMPATYYVAGSPELCGVEWDPGAEANKMTEGENGIYEITYDNIAAGDYALKVTSGAWDKPNWGGNGADGNFEFTLDQTSSVTVQFDAEAQVVSILVNGEDYVPVEKPFDPANATYYVAGVAALCGEDWNAAGEANKMTLGDDGKFVKVYENVAAGQYELKVTDGTWDNSWGNGADNYVFSVEAAGNVTVKFDAEAQAVTVEVGAAGSNSGSSDEKTDAPADDSSNNNAPAEESKDNTVLIVVGVVVVAAIAVVAVLLLKKKK